MFFESSSQASALPLGLVDCYEAINTELRPLLGGESEQLSRALPTLLQHMAELSWADGTTSIRQAALSLYSFQAALQGARPSEGDRRQIAVLLSALRGKIAPGLAECVAPEPLIAPPPSSGTSLRVCLYVESKSVRGLLEEALSRAGFEVTVLTAMSELGALVPGEYPMAVIADLALCRSDPDTYRTMCSLRQSPQESVHLVCIAGSDDFGVRLEAVRLGATRLLQRPLDVRQLLEMLQEVKARQRSDAYRVMLVDDDRSVTALYSEALMGIGMKVRVCHDPLKAPANVADFRPDVIVTDVYMPGCNGLELAAVLRQDESLADTPIIFLSSETDVHRKMLALDLGADEFLTKPVNLEAFRATVLGRARRASFLRRERREKATVAERLRQMEKVADAHSMVSITDAKGGILYANPNFCQTTGYALPELVGQNHRIVRSGAQPASLYETLWQTICSGEIWRGHLCNRARDGRLYWVDATIMPQVDETGLPVRFLSVQTDITALKPVSG